MRKFKLTNSKDDIKRVDIKITYRLDLLGMAHVLAAKFLSSGLPTTHGWFSDLEWVVVQEMIPGDISEVIKDTLYEMGENALQTDAPEELLEWAKRQAGKIVEE